MAVYKDNATGRWRVIYRFTNWKGERKQTQKRGFATKREALAWEHEAMLKQGAKLDMTFGSFFEVYEADKKQRVKESTWESKSHVIRTKILPYFENQKRINELAPMVKNMEKLAADFSADPEQTLPEAAVMESAKSYREKKAKPLVKKIVQVMRSVYSAYLDISNKFTKLQAAYNKERRGNERLTNRLEEVLEENRELRIVAADFGRVKAMVGSEQVNAVINRAKQQEQIEVEQKRAARRKHNRETR